MVCCIDLHLLVVLLVLVLFLLVCVVCIVFCILLCMCRIVTGITNSIITYGEEVVEQVKVDIDEDAEEESDIGEEIVVGTIGIGIHTNINPEVRVKRRHSTNISAIDRVIVIIVSMIPPSTLTTIYMNTKAPKITPPKNIVITHFINCFGYWIFSTHLRLL